MMKITNIFFMKILLAAATTVQIFIFVPAARADGNPGNDSSQMTVFITPSFDAGILIDTGNVHLNLGAMDMSASTQTVLPATITIAGNLAYMELDVSASITGGWVFDPNQTFESTGTNQLNVWASFTSISTANAPPQGYEYFRVGASSGAKLTSNTNVFSATRAGISGASGAGRFETNPASADMDSMMPDTKRHLWFYMRTPPTTSVTGQQEIQLNLSVTQGP